MEGAATPLVDRELLILTLENWKAIFAARSTSSDALGLPSHSSLSFHPDFTAEIHRYYVGNNAGTGW